MDCDGGRVSTLDLYPSGTYARRAFGGMGRIDGTIWRGSGLERVRPRAGKPVASAASYFSLSLLLHRIRDCPIGRVAGLGEFQRGPRPGTGGVSQRTFARWLASV